MGNYYISHLVKETTYSHAGNLARLGRIVSLKAWEM